MQISKTTPKQSNIDTALYQHIENYDLLNHGLFITHIFEKYKLIGFFENYIGRQNIEKNDNQYILQIALTLNLFEGILYQKIPDAQARPMLVACLNRKPLLASMAYKDRHETLSIYSLIEQENNSLNKRTNKLSEEELMLLKTLLSNCTWPYAKKKISNEAHQLFRDNQVMLAYFKEKETVIDYIKTETNLLNKHLLDTFEERQTLKSIHAKQLNHSMLIQWNTRWAKMKALHLNWPVKNSLLYT
jgi:hypothetical protein